MAMITSDVTFDVLQEINAELLKRIEYRDALELEGNLVGRARFEFILYLQRLTSLLKEEFNCDPKERCRDGSCPPCFEARNNQMHRFLDTLKERNTRDLA